MLHMKMKNFVIQQYIKEKYNKIDALINCAGVPGVQKLENVTYDVLDNLMKINVLAPIYLTTQLITLIKESEADILNVGSTIGTKAGYTDQISYTTSKWAIRGTSYNLQLELKKYLIDGLREIPQITIYNAHSKSGIVTINYDGIFPQDLSIYLDKYNICTRAGNHCAKILKEEIHIKTLFFIVNHHFHYTLFYVNSKIKYDKIFPFL